MLLSALGYFAFIGYILLRVEPGTAQIAGRFGFTVFHFIFLGMLVPSALWMPLTYMHIAHSDTGVWIGIRAVLFIVGLSSCALVWALLTLNVQEPDWFYRAAVAGSAWFAFHTLVLDGLVWPVLYRSS
jgi:predicted metal-binding membrane protein